MNLENCTLKRKTNVLKVNFENKIYDKDIRGASLKDEARTSGKTDKTMTLKNDATFLRKTYF